MAANKEPQFATAADLTTDTVSGTTRTVVLPGGKAVEVRGLTRYELVLHTDSGDPAELEARNIAACMVRPRMSLEQVQRWQRGTTPDVLRGVTEAIRDLSGLGRDAQKSSVDEVRD